MADNEGKVREVKIEGEEIVVTYSFKREDFNDGRLMGYSLFEEVKRKIAELLSKKIFEENKEKLVKEVLEGVNWPEVVRSEVAQEVIKTIAQTSRNY